MVDARAEIGMSRESDRESREIENGIGIREVEVHAAIESEIENQRRRKLSQLSRYRRTSS
jgi:hypothetical protein